MNKLVCLPIERPPKIKVIPQIKVRSNLSSGQSLDACLRNLYTWQMDYYKKCGGPKPTPYY